VGSIAGAISFRPGSLRRKAIAATLRRMANKDGRHSQLLRGVLDLCLLAVVEEEPAYGYEMTKRLRARGFSIVGEGSIYPLLGRLERDGLVETYRAASNGGPPRKYYRTSRKGRRLLAAGVSEWRATRDAVDALLGDAEVELQP
jgi:PadR family transcriptional regulator PadR